MVFSSQGGNGICFDVCWRQITMYNYALCTVFLYVVSLDNCNFVNISIILKSRIESHHSLYIAGTEIHLQFFMFVQRHRSGRSMTAESDFLNAHLTTELTGSLGAPGTRNMNMYTNPLNTSILSLHNSSIATALGPILHARVSSSLPRLFPPLIQSSFTICSFEASMGRMWRLRWCIRYRDVGEVILSNSLYCPRI